MSLLTSKLLNKLLLCKTNFVITNISFVICELQPQVKKTLEDLELDDVLNTAPTETEAWDIVQMEEIERELLDNV